MVSLENNSNYLNKIKNDKIIWIFYNFLSQNNIAIDLDNYQADTDKQYACFIKFLNENDELKFIEAYNAFSRRSPDQQSPWVNNDFLIFILIMGTTRFSLNREWLLQVVNTRSTQVEEQLKVNLTFKNILTDNLESKENVLEVITIFKYLGGEIIDSKQSNSLLKEMSVNADLFNKNNDFLVCCSITSFNAILISKGFTNQNYVKNLETFKETFSKTSDTIGIIFQIILLFFMAILTLHYYHTDEKLFNAIVSFAGLIGISIFSFTPKTKNFISRFIKKLFGYTNIFKQ